MRIVLSTDLDKFALTRGQYFDDRESMKLHPYRDDVSLIDVDESLVFEDAIDVKRMDSAKAPHARHTKKQEPEMTFDNKTDVEDLGEYSDEDEDIISRQNSLTNRSSVSSSVSWADGLRARSETEDTSLSLVVDEQVEDDYEEESKTDFGTPVILTPSTHTIRSTGNRGRSASGGRIPTKKKSSGIGRGRASSACAKQTASPAQLDEIAELKSDED
jgi:hypothetical protein